MGSHLGWDGQRLWLSQWYPKKLIPFSNHKILGPAITIPHEICGQAIVDDKFYLVTTDDEDSGDYFLTCVTPRASGPKVEVLAELGFSARGLAFDGDRFWSNHREANEIVSFTIPGITP